MGNYELHGIYWKIGVVPEFEWGLRITRHQTVVEKEIANGFFLLWKFVFLTSCRRLIYHIFPELFLGGYVVAISPNSSIALKNELSSVGLWLVFFSTRTED